MFMRKYTNGSDPVQFVYDGKAMAGRSGDSVAAALLLNGVMAFRTTPVSGRDRGPFCLMGTCFDCLVEIDGEPNRQACLVPLADGMVVRMQDGRSRVRAS